MTPLTAGAHVYRDHERKRAARRRLTDPVVQVAVLTNVFGKAWVNIVQTYGRPTRQETR